MKKRKIVKRIILLLLAGGLAYGIRYCWVSLPIAAGYGAKVMCSAVFVSGRKEADIKQHDLGFSPLHLATYTVNYRDSSVTASYFGLARRTAVFRQGLGATLVSQRTVQQVRAQRFRLAVPPPIHADTLPWPMGDRLAGSLPAGIDTARLAAAVAAGFLDTGPENGAGTRAVVVVYNGQLVAERYAPGFTRHTRLTGWSMTKSITGALVGVLVGQNRLDLDGPAPVPEWAGDARRAITVRQLLQQSSGLGFREVYSMDADATRMLFRRADMGGYAADHPLQHPPGTRFSYSSGNSNILSRIIRHTTGDRDYHAFPYEQLLYPIGMYNTVLEPDASGTFVGSSFCFAPARDWARFGLLYLNDGVWNGTRLLPEGWVRQSRTPAPAAPRGEHGLHFWLNAGQPGNPANRSYPDLPADLYYASGFEGQYVFILPSRNLVVVRLGFNTGGDYPFSRFLNGILQALPR